VCSGEDFESGQRWSLANELACYLELSMSTEMQRLKASHAKLSEQVKEARRVIALYRRWEQVGDIDIVKDTDIDSGSMLIEASFAAIAFHEKWEVVITSR
jgi:hypothetical protein